MMIDHRQVSERCQGQRYDNEPETMFIVFIPKASLPLAIEAKICCVMLNLKFILYSKIGIRLHHFVPKPVPDLYKPHSHACTILLPFV